MTRDLVVLLEVTTLYLAAQHLTYSASQKLQNGVGLAATEFTLETSLAVQMSVLVACELGGPGTGDPSAEIARKQSKKPNKSAKRNIFKDSWKARDSST